MKFLGSGDYLFVAVCFLVALFQTKPYLHIYQLEGYKAVPMLRSKIIRRAYFIDVIISVVYFALWGGIYFAPSRIFWGFFVAAFFFVSIFGVHFVFESVAKKPLVYTRRATTLTIFNSIMVALIVALGLIAINHYFKDSYHRYLIFYGYSFVFPLIFVLSAMLIAPFEKLNHLRYERRTIKTLQTRPDLIKIAISGSYGKTSVKNYLAAMLKENFCVLATKESYNTPMGISKTVANLCEQHEVLIVEMGARQSGDIKKLMRIVKPTHGILTGITAQHLETFGTIENVIEEKELVIRMLLQGGTAVANGECEYIALDRENLSYVGFSDACECYADNIVCTESGSAFYLHIGDEVAVCFTALIGQHNVMNISLAAAMAHNLGISLEKIAKVITNLKPVPHRLQLTKGNGITIIDDSFNSSPVGARAALDALKLFSGRKIVLTPGLIELGDAEFKENFELGKEMSKIADGVLLVGQKRSQPLLEGLLSEGFQSDDVLTFESLSQAQENFPKYLHAGDVLLILNDLPDNYNE